MHCMPSVVRGRKAHSCGNRQITGLPLAELSTLALVRLGEAQATDAKKKGRCNPVDLGWAGLPDRNLEPTHGRAGRGG